MSDVRTESAAVSEMGCHWPMLRALLGGTHAMRAAGKAYLPKWPNEAEDAYAARLAVATLYPAYSRTVEVMAGKPFAKPLTLGEDVPARIQAWCDDIDLQGRNLHTFASDIMRDVMGYGVSGVLVDYPRADGVRTLADEQAMGARPYFTRYAPGTVLGWRTERRGGATRLTQLRLLESVEVEDGPFAVKCIEQVRVLVPGAWATFRKQEAANRASEWVQFEEGTTTLQEIPFVFFYGQWTGFGVGVPPLLELAHQNVEHWQSSSDQSAILHVARVPILTIIGANDDTKITVGASSAVSLPVGADMKFVEHSGASIEAGRQSLLDLEERMRQTGAELLVLKPGQITATQVTSESEANKSALQRIAEGVEDALDACLQFAADWVGEATGGTVTLFKDYAAATLADAMKDVIAMNVSDQTKFEEAQRRGIISSDRTWDEESERLEMQGPALGTVGVEDGERQ